MKSAKKFEQIIKLEHSKNGGRLFRNNVGKAYQGKTTRLSNGAVMIEHPRLIEFGMQKGASDLIGWTTIEITQEMVGQKVAVFTAIELKTETDKSSPEQEKFVKNVNNSGGFAKIIYNLQEYQRLINSKNQ